MCNGYSVSDYVLSSLCIYIYFEGEADDEKTEAMFGSAFITGARHVSMGDGRWAMSLRPLACLKCTMRNKQ